MDSRRLGIALAAALIISIAITSLFYFRVSRQQASAKPKVKRVMAAAVALQPGVPIMAENLVEIDWPEGVLLEGLIDPKSKDELIGHVLVYPVGEKQPILRRDIASPGSFGLAAKIPDGMRATAVKTNEINNVAGFMFPGARVDVLATLRGDNNLTTTRTVLQNVQVLSTGTKIEPDPNGKPENVSVITLLVTPEESEKVVLAQNQGSIQFSLRNGGDAAKVDTPSVDLADLAGTPRKVAQPEVARPKRIAVAKVPSVYSVETIVGGKSTVARFPE